MQVKTINEKFYLKAFFARSESKVYTDKGPIFSKNAAEIALIFLIYAAMFCLAVFLTLEFTGFISWLSREAAFSPFNSEMSENLRLSR